MEEYKCMKCGKLILETEGITNNEGLWICDNEECESKEG